MCCRAESVVSLGMAMSKFGEEDKAQKKKQPIEASRVSSGTAMNNYGEQDTAQKKLQCHVNAADVPPGVILHDNLLFDDSQTSTLEENKARTALEAAAMDANKSTDSITQLCEEVSRLFTQYNAAFKCNKNTSTSNHHLQTEVLRLCNMLRCVEPTNSDNNKMVTFR